MTNQDETFLNGRITIGSDGGYRIVYVDGKERRKFCVRSDDFAYTNAREYAEHLAGKGL